MDEVRRPYVVGLFAVCVAFVLAGQVVASATAPAPVSTGTAVGRAGFAYLTGIRTFAAAVLWTRLDLVGDGYYEDVPLVKQRQMLPSIALITALDPQLVDAYTVGGWVVARNGRPKTALKLLRAGAASNPDSGHVRIVMAEVLSFFEKDEAAALREVDRAVRLGWTNGEDEYSDLAFARSLYQRNGRTADAARIEARMAELEPVAAESGHE